MIIAIRTDKPTAELYIADNNTIIAEYSWHAHRQLADTIHSKIAELLQAQGADWQDISGIIVYKGPGSFTGLRIGVTVANTLAYSLHVSIVGTTDTNWLNNGLEQLANGKTGSMIIPEYGGTVHITNPVK